MNSNNDVDSYVIRLLKNIEEGEGFWYDNIEKLGKVDNSVIVKHIKKYLESMNKEERRSGVEILMRTYPDANLKLIIPFLKDIEPEVRFVAIYYLIRVDKFTNDIPLINFAISVLQTDLSPDVRAEVAEVLGYVNVNIQEVINILLWVKNNDREFSSLGHSVSHVAENALKNISQRGQ